jgi:hypothetical protein
MPLASHVRASLALRPKRRCNSFVSHFRTRPPRPSMDAPFAGVRPTRFQHPPPPGFCRQCSVDGNTLVPGLRAARPSSIQDLIPGPAATASLPDSQLAAEAADGGVPRLLSGNADQPTVRCGKITSINLVSVKCQPESMTLVPSHVRTSAADLAPGRGKDRPPGATGAHVNFAHFELDLATRRRRTLYPMAARFHRFLLGCHRTGSQPLADMEGQARSPRHLIKPTRLSSEGWSSSTSLATPFCAALIRVWATQPTSTAKTHAALRSPAQSFRPSTAPRSPRRRPQVLSAGRV